MKPTDAELIRAAFKARSFANGSPRAIAIAINVSDAQAFANTFFNRIVFGIETAARVLGMEPVDFPQETAIGALSLYVSGGSSCSPPNPSPPDGQMIPIWVKN